MKTVRLHFVVIFIGFLMVSAAMAQDKMSQSAAKGPATVYQSKFPVTLQAGEYDLKTVILDFPQGAGVPNHLHGGYVLVTVLDGEITLKDKTGERVVKTGESWTENPGDLHSVVNSGAATARVAITMILQKGAETTTVIKP
ncbi:MAG TPA: cupin domain-containing protein [Thermodesulfovibrionales bacterium]|nr:cupin domain-containing protein [Thermodesulfovibrionales bacterium]